MREFLPIQIYSDTDSLSIAKAKTVECSHSYLTYFKMYTRITTGEDCVCLPLIIRSVFDPATFN